MVPQRWCSFDFSVGVHSAGDGINHEGVVEIPEKNYFELVKNAIDKWHNAIQKSKYEHIRKINFKVEPYENDKEGCYNIIIHWDNEKEQSFGHASHAPYPDVDCATIQRAYIHISKNVVDTSGQKTFMSKEDVESILTHEFGHALGLGHCSYFRDMMFQSNTDRPRKNRQISTVDLKLLSELFTNLDDSSLPYPITHTHPFDDWKEI